MERLNLIDLRLQVSRLDKTRLSYARLDLDLVLDFTPMARHKIGMGKTKVERLDKGYIRHAQQNR